MPYQKGEGKSVVIALGGNALGNTPQEQLELVKATAKNIVDMVEEGINVVVSHGNGPQVGMINNAFAYASANDGKTPEMPFPEAGAMSQGYIGYQLSQAILNDMKLRGIDRSTACVVTQTVVDPADPAFQNPTKPVGAFLSEEEAKAKAAETGWTFKEDAGRGWRQVVASPKPVRIVEFDAVKDLMDAGYIVVSTGGGGVPVFEKEGLYEGVPAVIDKDRSSAKLAADFGADMLVILTAVEKVCVNFGKPDQAEIDTMTIAEAEEFIAQGRNACHRNRGTAVCGYASTDPLENFSFAKISDSILIIRRGCYDREGKRKEQEKAIYIIVYHPADHPDRAGAGHGSDVAGRCGRGPRRHGRQCGHGSRQGLYRRPACLSVRVDPGRFPGYRHGNGRAGRRYRSAGEEAQGQ